MRLALIALIALLAALALAACSVDDTAPPPDPGEQSDRTLADLVFDPIVERVPGPEDHDVVRGRAEALAADVAAGRLTSCEAAARLYTPAAFSNADAAPAAWLAVRSRLLAGLDPALIAGSDGSEVHGFDDSGFQLRFRDGSNQVRHLAAAVQAGASLGPAAVLHRLLRPDTPQDEALNDVAVVLGAALLAGDLPPRDAGDWIRANVCNAPRP